MSWNQRGVFYFKRSHQPLGQENNFLHAYFLSDKQKNFLEVCQRSPKENSCSLCVKISPENIKTESAFKLKV